MWFWHVVAVFADGVIVRVHCDSWTDGTRERLPLSSLSRHCVRARQTTFRRQRPRPCAIPRRLPATCSRLVSAPHCHRPTAPVPIPSPPRPGTRDPWRHIAQRAPHRVAGGAGVATTRPVPYRRANTPTKGATGTHQPVPHTGCSMTLHPPSTTSSLTVRATSSDLCVCACASDPAGTRHVSGDKSMAVGTRGPRKHVRVWSDPWLWCQRRCRQQRAGCRGRMPRYISTRHSPRCPQHAYRSHPTVSNPEGTLCMSLRCPIAVLCAPGSSSTAIVWC